MSAKVSFIGAFSVGAVGTETIARIEIPLIQRDFAQGRQTTKVDEIRRSFLNVLYEAIGDSTQKPASLDFVYGKIENHTLEPLDGQQRLTTLFLLHWYFAVRSGNLESDAPWAQFSYATRQSARRFCERLVQLTSPVSGPAFEDTGLSDWIMDQPWYLFVWRYDPTIQAMLVMLDAIHERFSSSDPDLAWQRLTDTDQPAISFHLLPLPDMGVSEDLYIKMNSRGKLLTEFENFKAHFEKTIEWSPRGTELAHKVDIEWSDLLWGFRGQDNLIDEEFMRCFQFITEVCHWTDSELEPLSAELPLTEWSERIYGKANPRRQDHLDFLFQVFDVLSEHNISAVFDEVFTHDYELSGSAGKVSLFFRDQEPNLFKSCCQGYGVRTGGRNRVFTFGQTLLLLAVVIHLNNKTEDFPRRVRVLRNLIEGSISEVRSDRMPQLVQDTRTLILTGQLPKSGNSFSASQIDDEQAKAQFISEHPDMEPELNALEDPELLRGSLQGFELQAPTFAKRAEAFQTLIDSENLWSDAAAALLTVGDYQRKRGFQTLTRSFQFAPPDARFPEVWRTLLTAGTRAELAQTRDVFGKFLDVISNSETPLAQTLQEMQHDWLSKRELAHLFDWRYYFVKYPSMRAGGSGIYFVEEGKLGFLLCNLRGNRTQLNSMYRDPYLLTIWRELGEPQGIEDPWFQGYEWSERGMWLISSDSTFGCRTDGFYLSRPENPIFESAFDNLPQNYLDDEEEYVFFEISQVEHDGELIDVEDRIQAGVAFVRELLELKF